MNNFSNHLLILFLCFFSFSRNLQEREEALAEKERIILELRNTTRTLENFRFVLDHRFSIFDFSFIFINFYFYSFLFLFIFIHFYFYSFLFLFFFLSFLVMTENFKIVDFVVIFYNLFISHVRSFSYFYLLICLYYFFSSSAVVFVSMLWIISMLILFHSFLNDFLFIRKSIIYHCSVN